MQSALQNWRKQYATPGTHLINREWVRCFLAGVWQGATKEHSHRRSVTEEQRRQTPARKQPGGLPIFAAAAALLVSRRSIRIFSFLTPCSGAKSLATHPLPIYERGSSEFDKMTGLGTENEGPLRGFQPWFLISAFAPGHIPVISCSARRTCGGLTG